VVLCYSGQNMKREIKFFPAWDKSDPDPKKDYGVNCLDIVFQVVGELGITEFEISTNWYLEHVMERRLKSMKQDVLLGKEDFLLNHFWMYPFPMDFCYYSPVRKSEDDCYWEDGATLHVPQIVPVYYGYKFMDESEDKMAKDVAYWKLVSEGDESLWKYLEDYYVEVFGELR